MRVVRQIQPKLKVFYVFVKAITYGTLRDRTIRAFNSVAHKCRLVLKRVGMLDVRECVPESRLT